MLAAQRTPPRSLEECASTDELPHHSALRRPICRIIARIRLKYRYSSR